MYFVIYGLVFLVVFIGVLVIILAVHQSGVSNARKNQESINLKANDTLKNSNFSISKKFFLNDYATYNQSDTCKKSIAVDNDNKQICFIDYAKGSLFIVNFNEILNYEIYENGSNATTGGSIGGFGTRFFGAETNGMCKELKLIVRLKRYDTSQVSYDIITNTSFNIGINKSTQPYKQCISTLQEVVSFLEVIKNENDKRKDTDK